MAKRMLTLALLVASFAALAPAEVIYGGYGYVRPVARARVYVGPRYYYGPRVPYVAPYYYGYAPRYHRGPYRYYRGYRR